MAFSGWPTAALEFYEGLETDNSKAYWTSHKAVYQEQVLRPMEELLEDLAGEFGPSKIFRPYRDIRFSNDKTPYKTHIGATVGGTGYVQFSADGMSAGTGMWHLEPDELIKYRAAVAGPDGAELAAIVAGLERDGRRDPRARLPQVRAARLPGRPPQDRAAQAQGPDHVAALEPVPGARHPGRGRERRRALPDQRDVLRVAQFAYRSLSV